MSVGWAKLTSHMGALPRFFSRPWSPIRVIRMAYEFVTDRPYADPEKAARTLLEIANTVDVV